MLEIESVRIFHLRSNELKEIGYRVSYWEGLSPAAYAPIGEEGC